MLRRFPFAFVLLALSLPLHAQQRDDNAMSEGEIEQLRESAYYPGDRILVFETGAFSLHWKTIAERLGLRVDYVPGNWRSGARRRLGDEESQRSKNSESQANHVHFAFIASSKICR